METLLAILTVYLLTISISLEDASEYDNGQELRLHATNEQYLFNTSPEINTINRKRIRRRSHDRNPNRMHYPDEHPPSTRISSRNCSFGLCEEVENYPTEKIKKLVSQSEIIQNYFADQPPTVDIFTRFSDEGENLCATRIHTVFPKSAQNIHGEEQILVNLGDFKQGVNFEICVNPNQPCKLSEIFPVDYTTTCVQKYTVRRLMTVKEGTDKPVFDNFQMPSCCICTIKKKL